MRLRDWKNKKGLTFDAIAKDLGVTQAHISMISNGSRKPSVELLAKIIRYTKGEVGEEFTVTDKEIQHHEPKKQENKKEDNPARISIDLPPEDVDEVKNIVWWLGGDITITSFFRDAIKAYIKLNNAPKLSLCHPHSGANIEKPAGHPFPPREGVMRRGRPLGS